MVQALSASTPLIDERAQVDRSIVWNNSFIGERAELRGAIVGSSTSIKSKAVMFEGSVIGDNSIVEEGAIIQPNIKIWPDKEIEAGAVVNSSIIWGSQGKTRPVQSLRRDRAGECGPDAGVCHQTGRGLRRDSPQRLSGLH